MEAPEAPPPYDPERLVLDLDGFEGPLDLLLTLARSQKVDLTRISILALVEQYLDFINTARRLKLELAADYLVMAAWLAFLKSRLLLPKEDTEEEPSAEDLALRLQLRLQRLEAMRDVGARLMARARLGRDVFMRGAPEGLEDDRRGIYDLSLYELLRAYGDHQIRHQGGSLRIERRPVYAMEDALERLRDLIGDRYSWSDLMSFLPPVGDDPRMRRSALASLFAASLELTRQGKAVLNQTETYGPLYLRARDAVEAPSPRQEDDT
ncbi:segregation and condensation protein A [Yunchengibacter salinarum]|uniref:segregation and condensation protein A n=1 Tax=Yunchengibacter salinarum TaxID=3133399 RepID=UPI0035B681CC